MTTLQRALNAATAWLLILKNTYRIGVGGCSTRKGIVMKYEIYKTRDGLLIPVLYPEDAGQAFRLTVPDAVKVSEGTARNTIAYGIVPTRMRRQPFPVHNNIWRDRELLGALSGDHNRWAFVDYRNEVAPKYPLSALHSNDEQ